MVVAQVSLLISVCNSGSCLLSFPLYDLVLHILMILNSSDLVLHLLGVMIVMLGGLRSG